jgi:hypothetical protein
VDATTGIDPSHALVVCTLNNCASRVNPSSICYFDVI